MPTHWIRRHRLALALLGGLVVLAAVAFVLHALAGDDVFSLMSTAAGDRAYLATFLLVFGDALIPVLPGETTLNAAATLAAQGKLELELVIAAGALGAILGDSALYWCARISRKRVEPSVAKVRQDPRIASALEILGSSAPLLLTFGRFVPGVRFFTNATYGLAAYPYRRFLLWSAIGGTLWSVYTCVLAYNVATTLAGYPLASIIISSLVTTCILAVLLFVGRRHRRHKRAEAAR